MKPTAEIVNWDTSSAESGLELRIKMTSEPDSSNGENRTKVSLAPKRRFRSVLPKILLADKNAAHLLTPIAAASRRHLKMRRSGHLPLRWPVQPNSASGRALIGAQ